ncbi:hypothetical protein [Cellulosimicrobium sp. 22601]|uniref:hypothetical protein n=1 Tax=unclassified Cellulosimicrobium TaxID=2624466 RepID=UPI003F877963
MPVFARHWDGLSDPRNGHAGKPDRASRWVLYVTPVATALAVFVLDVDLSRSAEALIAGFALTAGVLLAAFTQLASWRNRLDERARDRPDSEAPARRSVDAAVAHSLMGVWFSVVATVLAVVLNAGAAPARLWSALTAASGIYLALMMALIVVSVYVGYESSVDEAVRKADEELLEPENRPVVAPHPRK